MNPKTKPKYKAFIDDTGGKSYSDPYNPRWENILKDWRKYRGFAERNFFVLTAVIIDVNAIPTINKSVNLLKFKYFKTTKVELKSVWFRNPTKVKEHYLDIYNIQKADLINFINEYYQLISSNNDIKVLSVVFNKMAFTEKNRSKSDGNPFLKSTQVMFERLTFLNKPLEVVIDQMENNLKKTKGKNGDMFRVYSKSENFKIDFKLNYKNIIDINFKKSSSENFLQMADLCGYNVFRQYVDFGIYSDFKERYIFFDKIYSNLINQNGNILGKGIVRLGINRKQKILSTQDFLKSVS